MEDRKGMPVWLIVLLAVLGVVVLMVGSLGVLAYIGMRRFIAASKTAEAVNTVNQIALAARTAYEEDLAFCESASSPVPASMSDVKGIKYMSKTADWDADKATNAGFACLKFSMTYPQYYQYDYKKTGPDAFSAIAHGDLDGNGITSSFIETGHLSGKMLVVDPLVRVNENE